MDMFGAPVYSPAQLLNEIPPNKSETVDSPDPPKQDTGEADLLSKSRRPTQLLRAYTN